MSVLFAFAGRRLVTTGALPRISSSVWNSYCSNLPSPAFDRPRKAVWFPKDGPVSKLTNSAQFPPSYYAKLKLHETTYSDLNEVNLQEYVRLIEGDIKAASRLAEAFAARPDLCGLPDAVQFVSRLVERVRQDDALLGDVDISLRVACSASAICHHNPALEGSERERFQALARLALEQDGCLVGEWSAAPRIDACKIVWYMHGVLSAEHVDRVVEMLLVDADTAAAVSRDLALCVSFLHPFLTTHQRKLLLSPLECLDLSRIYPSNVIGVLSMFYKRLPGLVPANAKAYAEFLSVHVHELDISLQATMWEMCVRWKIVSWRAHPQLAAWLDGLLRARSDALSMEMLAALLTPVIFLSRQDAGAADEWKRLAVRHVLPIRNRRCSGRSVDGLPMPAALACSLLWILCSLRECPDDLFQAWLGICLDSIAQLTFHQVLKMMEAYSWWYANVHRTRPASCHEVRLQLSRGLFLMPSDGSWLADINEEKINQVYSICNGIRIQQLFLPVPAKLAADWLVRRCSVDRDPDTWFALAMTCAAMGVQPRPIALTALSALECGVPIQPRQASMSAWLGGPLANVLPRDSASRLLAIVASQNLDWCTEATMERLLVVCSWFGADVDAGKSTIVQALGTQFSSFRRPKANNRRTLTDEVIGQLQNDMGRPLVAIGDWARADYLPVTALLLYSVSQRRFVTVCDNLPVWACLSAEARRSGDLRAVGVLPRLSGLFFLDKIQPLEGATATRQHDIFHDSVMWSSPRLQTYCRALVTQGLHAVLPLHVSSGSLAAIRAGLAAHVFVAAMASQPSHQPFCPPWREAGKLAVGDFFSA